MRLKIWCQNRENRIKIVKSFFKIAKCATLGWQNRATKEIWKAQKDTIEKALWVPCGPYGTVEITVSGEKITFTGIKQKDFARLEKFFDTYYGIHCDKLDTQTRG